ncbi:MAG: MoxR family ATPase [Woeseiaceae bacterium]|nr:MoxR family ATPase [Woeseiaceae bacterium]
MAETNGPASLPASIAETQDLLSSGDYVADRELATVVYLALSLGRPLLLEGESGVGKTELAKVLAGTLGRELVRLQCYEGLDLANAAYEWDYPRQLVAIRIAEAEGRLQDVHSTVYSRDFLVERPLLRALKDDGGAPPVLLIDEIDRADEPFEAYLLELLSDYQISIPELGTVRAKKPPVVVITSNRTREVHDALRRRCLYHWVHYPDPAAEMRIVALKVPGIAEDLRRQLIEFVRSLRELDLYKKPGVAETIDWAEALSCLNTLELDADTVAATIGTLLKYQDDVESVRGREIERLLASIQSAA